MGRDVADNLYCHMDELKESHQMSIENSSQLSWLTHSALNQLHGEGEAHPVTGTFLQVWHFKKKSLLISLVFCHGNEVAVSVSSGAIEIFLGLDPSQMYVRAPTHPPPHPPRHCQCQWSWHPKCFFYFYWAIIVRRWNSWRRRKRVTFSSTSLQTRSPVINKSIKMI